MTLGREQRLKRGGAAPESLELTPEEYFVLSRVEGAPTVGEVLVTSGLAQPDVERILDKLLQLGAIVVTSDRPVRPAQPPLKPAGPKTPVVRASVATLEERVRQRRRRTLAAALQPYRPGESERADDGDADDEDDAVEFERHALELIGLDDERIDPSLAIDLDDQRWVLTLLDGEEKLTPFEFLGLAPTHDAKAIKRAFRDTSRRLHPDSYYGKNLGGFPEILSKLFRRAKFYYGELRKESVRAPYVDRHIEYRARLERSAEEKEQRQRAAEELQRQQAEAEAAVRRQQRAQARADRNRAALRAKMAEEAERLAADARGAEEAGNMAKAANLYRLALRADPRNLELEAAWARCRDRARETRANDAFARAMQYTDMGQSQEAGKLFIEAAQAHPTAEHLAHAVEAVRHTDQAKARDYALAALDALRQDHVDGKQRKPHDLGALHILIARGFLAAGLKESARQQALVAQSLRPDDIEVRALLKSIKVK